MITTENRLHHPEKAHRPESAVPRKLAWIRVARAENAGYVQTRQFLKEQALSTYCEEAVCPNSTLEELRQVMDDMRIAGVDILTVGQYLQPIDRFLSPDEFRTIKDIALSKGFMVVSATPMTRSSFHADNGFAALRSARVAQTVSKELRNG